MMDPDFDFKAMMKEYGRMRDRYLDAVRDWVANGPGSRWALTPEQVRARMAGPNPDHARAAAYFRLGTCLHEQGRSAAAQEAFAEAKRLSPESWSFKRQGWQLEVPGDVQRTGRSSAVPDSAGSEAARDRRALVDRVDGERGGDRRELDRSPTSDVLAAPGPVGIAPPPLDRPLTVRDEHVLAERR